MSHIAVLGLGAMGTRMAMNLLKAGHDLVVWNRTPAAAAPLVRAGARQADTPRAAASGASVVMAMLRDDVASRQVWLDAENGAMAGLSPHAIAIESSTLSPDWVRELGQVMAAQGKTLLEAPVSGSLPQAEAAQLVYLVGGQADHLAQVEPLLKVMGASAHLTGPLGSGALVKLATNTLLGVQVAVLAELTAMLRRSGADPAHAFQAISATPVWSIIAQRIVASMLPGDYTPLFPIELIEKDFGYTMDVIGSPQTAPVISATHQVFQTALASGFGDEHMTAVLKLYPAE